MTSYHSPDEGLQNHRVSNKMFTIGMTAVPTVFVAGSSVSTLITMFFRQLLYSGYAGSYLYSSAWP